MFLQTLHNTIPRSINGKFDDVAEWDDAGANAFPTMFLPTLQNTIPRNIIGKFVDAAKWDNAGEIRRDYWHRECPEECPPREVELFYANIACFSSHATNISSPYQNL